MKKIESIVILIVGMLLGMSLTYLLNIYNTKEQIEENNKIIESLNKRVAELNLDIKDDTLEVSKNTTTEKVIIQEVDPTFSVGDETITLNELLKITNENSDKITSYERKLDYLKRNLGLFVVQDSNSFYVEYTDNSLIQKTKDELFKKTQEASRLKQVISLVEDIEKIKIEYKFENGNIIVNTKKSN